jgi:glycosyltransferase involved in cell wall biosynthesis
MMARQRLGERFRFLGWLKTPQLQELYNALDLCVNTSAEESFGLSVLESLACGCPVVGYPSVSVSEVVLPDGGQIVPQNDIDALATAVRKWLTDRQRLAAARPLARRQAQRFDIAEISQQLWKEYQDVLAEHRESRRSRFSLVGRG